MYFRVSDEFLTRPQELSEAVVALRNLISAHRAGHHHVVIGRTLCDYIVEHCDLSLREKELIVSYVKARHTVAASELKGVWRFVECIPDACAPILEPNAVAVRLRHFDNPMHVGSTRILVEELVVDGPALELLVHLYSKFLLRRNQRMSFSLVHGGGAGTGAVFRHASESPQPLICIVDSDRRYFGGPMGNTATAVLAALNDAPFPTAFVSVLPVREMENALPLRLVRIVYQDIGAHDVAGCCQGLIEFCESGLHAEVDRAKLIAFLDFKEGLSAADVLAIGTTYADLLKAFWEHQTSSVPAPDLDTPEFLNEQPFEGIAVNLVRVVNARIKDRPYLLRDIGRNLRRHPFGAELASYVQQVCDLCAAPAPLPVRLS